MYDYFNNVLGIGKILPTDGEVMEQRNPAMPVNPYSFDQGGIDTRARRPLQQTSLTQQRIGDVTSAATAKAQAFTARAKGIGAKARVMDQNRRNALGLSSNENRRRTQ